MSDNTKNDVFIERFRIVLFRKRMTQKELAQRLGMPPSQIGAYAVGTRTPSMETLIKIAKVLEVSTDYLLGLSE